MDTKIKIVIMLASISIFVILFHFTIQDLIFPPSNLVTNLHFRESKYYTVLEGGIINLDRDNYVYPNDRLSYLVILNKKPNIGQIYINASLQYIVGNTIAETYDFGYLQLGGSSIDTVSYPYPFSARQEGTNEIRLILNIYDSHGKPIDWVIEETPFQVLSTSDKLQSDLVNATIAGVVFSGLIGIGTITALILNQRTSKMQVKELEKQNGNIKNQIDQEKKDSEEHVNALKEQNRLFKEQFNLENRPWIGIEDIYPTMVVLENDTILEYNEFVKDQATLNSKPKIVRVTTVIENVGKTPAKNISLKGMSQEILFTRNEIVMGDKSKLTVLPKGKISQIFDIPWDVWKEQVKKTHHVGVRITYDISEEQKGDSGRIWGISHGRSIIKESWAD